MNNDPLRGWRFVIPWLLSAAIAVGFYLLILSAWAEHKTLEALREDCTTVPYYFDKLLIEGRECVAPEQARTMRATCVVISAEQIAGRR